MSWGYVAPLPMASGACNQPRARPWESQSRWEPVKGHAAANALCASSWRVGLIRFDPDSRGRLCGQHYGSRLYEEANRAQTWKLSGQRWHGRHGIREEDIKRAPAACNIARLPRVS